MHTEILARYFSQQNQDLIIKFIENFGIFAGITLPIIETFIPLLPLILFVSLNVFFFGFFWGYIFSWMGNCLGSILLFMFIRYIRRKKHFGTTHKDSKYQKIKDRINKNDFIFLFVLLCFPFTPSFAVTIISSVSDIKIEHFLIALLPAKLIMILSLSFIGFNLYSFIDHPIRSVLFLIGVVIMSLIGGKFMKYYHNKYE